MNTMQILVNTLVIAALFGPSVAAGTEDVPNRVGTWKADGFGNHRVKLKAGEQADAVWAHVEWRRRDLAPEKLETLVVDAATGKRVANVVRVNVNREFGDIVFQPATAPGEYDLYFMPYTESIVQWNYQTHYMVPEAKADLAWVERNGLRAEQLDKGKWKTLPQALVVAIETRSAFDGFDPMEVTATAEEARTLLAAHPKPYLLFPEDRRFPIRMTDDLPQRWIKAGPGASFAGETQQGEYFVFQIGMYAAQTAIPGLGLEFSPLTPKAGKAIPATEFRCINLGGTDWLGREMRKTVTVAKGKVQALWIGVQIPPDATGNYTGTVTVKPQGLPETKVSVALKVAPEVLADHGDNDLWRMARLRWLDSKIGLDDEVVAPYTPLQVDGAKVSCLGRQVVFGGSGLPESIQSGGREVLAAPVAFEIRPTNLGAHRSSVPQAKVAQTAPGAVRVTSEGAVAYFGQSTTVKMEADGYLTTTIRVKANQDGGGQFALELPFKRDIAKYMMGLGRKGGFRREQWKWKWDARRANNTLWIGDVDAGLYLKLKGPEDTWDIYSLSGLPDAWHSGGKGGVTVTEEGDQVLVRATSGERQVKAGEELVFRFALLVTPVKPLDSAHWNQRYYHMVPSTMDAVRDCGANIVNIHHGNDYNPNINYPFVATDKLAALVKQAHAAGIKLKIYYTVRELSNRVAEMFSLRSLGFEVFSDGGGHGGHSWLQEHLVEHYAPAWHQPYGNGEVDAAIVTTGLSRWHNYYLEGLSWLIKNVQIDGLYLDGIGYDREIMKRVRKVMDRARPGGLIDFHSGNEFPFGDLRVSPACKYMEHFPYINSLWFGEGYDYNETPDYWLVEVSGLPFGLYGEMLEGNGNPWRGMVYGMTARYYSGADPKHIWKLWDDFGIQQAKMVGYWDRACPVQTDNADVLATTYVKEGKTLIAIASWAKDSARVRLRMDWAALKLDPAKATLWAPRVQGFQSEAVFKPGDDVPVMPGRGWLLVADEGKHEIAAAPDVYQGRQVILEERFAGETLAEPWKIQATKRPGNELKVVDGQMKIAALANCAIFAERPIPAGATLAECEVFLGSDRGATWGPGIALVWLDGAAVRVNLRAEGRFGADAAGRQFCGGTVLPNGWYKLRIRLEKTEIVTEGSGDGLMWETVATIPRAQHAGDPAAVRVGKMAGDRGNEDWQELGPGGECAVRGLKVWR